MCSMKEVAVAIMHGMGHRDKHFTDGLIEKLDDFLGSGFKGSVGWIPLHWNDLLGGSQKRYLARTNRNQQMDWSYERDFAIHMVGDIIAFQPTVGVKNTYEKVHASIASKLMDAWIQQFQRRNVPLIWVSNSLGSHVMSTYIWDTMRDQPYPEIASFLCQKTIRYVFTTGSTIPLFTFAHKTPKPIQLPPDARWFNLYDRDDILGWPLKTINPAYSKAVTQDIEINVGGRLSNWNPLSHLNYWEDDDVIQHIGSAIKDVLR